MSGMIIPMGQEIYFDAITSGSDGAVTDADSLPAPAWQVFEQETDTPILSGNFTKRVGHTGNYRATFTLTDTAGFVIGNFYSVIGEATVNGIYGKCVCLIFRCGPSEDILGVPNVNVVNVELYPALTIADELLDRDMGLGTDSGTETVRTVRQALRMLRNRWYIDSGVLYVYAEDDATLSWTGQPSTDANAEPITGVNPAGGA